MNLFFELLNHKKMRNMIADVVQVYQFRELLRSFVSKELRSRYKGSVLGFLWNFLIPLLQLAVFYILFGIIIRVFKTEQYPYAVFVFAGLLPWIFFTNAVQGGAASVVANANLVKKVFFPLQLLPLASVLSSFINFLLGLIILFGWMIVLRLPFFPTLLLLPVVFLVQLIFIGGLAYWSSCLNVYYRDVEHILSILLMAWFYVTPIIFPISLMSDRPFLEGIIMLNPLASIIIAYQRLILDGTLPDWTWFSYSAGIGLLLLVSGFFVFNRFKFFFEEEL